MATAAISVKIIKIQAFFLFIFFKNKGVRAIQRTEHRRQMTEDKEQTVSVFCHLTSDICYLTPDTIVIAIFVK